MILYDLIIIYHDILWYQSNQVWHRLFGPRSCWLRWSNLGSPRGIHEMRFPMRTLCARRWQGRLSSILRLKTWKTWHSKFECTEIGFPEFSSFPVFHWLVMCRCRCVFFSCFSSRGTVAKHHAPSFGPAARPRDRGIDTVAGELGLLGDDIWDEISKWCIGSIGLWWIIWYYHTFIIIFDIWLKPGWQSLVGTLPKTLGWLSQNCVVATHLPPIQRLRQVITIARL
jgi:hypothetical protein